MKTLNKIKKECSLDNAVQKLMTTLLLTLVLVGCSKDDSPSESTIKAQATTFTMEDINGCNHSSGGKGTRFLFTTTYTNEQDLEITGIVVKFIPSAGNSDEVTINSGILDDGNLLTWGGCLRFFESDWFDIEIRLKSVDGKASNVSKVRVNRPNGAG